jgi:hypothetical protein
MEIRNLISIRLNEKFLGEINEEDIQGAEEQETLENEKEVV